MGARALRVRDVAFCSCRLGDVREDIDRAARRLPNGDGPRRIDRRRPEGRPGLFGVLARATARRLAQGRSTRDAADALRTPPRSPRSSAPSARVRRGGRGRRAPREAAKQGMARRGRRRDRRALVAPGGPATGFSVASEEARDARNAARHNGLATYAGVARVRAVNAKRFEEKEKRTLSPVPHALLAPFASPHADVGLMCLSATVILSCFILRRDALVGPPPASSSTGCCGKTVAHSFAGCPSGNRRRRRGIPGT